MSPVYAEPYVYLRSCYDPVPTGTAIQADSTRDITELHSCRRRQSPPADSGPEWPGGILSSILSTSYYS